MSKAAFSAKVFAVYLFIVGPVLVLAPNFLLSIFKLPQTTDIWIHVIGVLAFNIGIYVWVSAENKDFLKASVYTRCIFFVAVTSFALMGMVSPMIILFGITDLLGALWTHFALAADKQAARPGLAVQP